MKSDLVLAKAAVIDSLRIGAMRGLDHNVGVFNQLKVFTAGAAFRDPIEHRPRLEQCALFVRHDALPSRIALCDLNRIASVDDEPCGGAIAGVFAADIGRHNKNISLT